PAAALADARDQEQGDQFGKKESARDQRRRRTALLERPRLVLRLVAPQGDDRVGRVYVPETGRRVGSRGLLVRRRRPGRGPGAALLAHPLPRRRPVETGRERGTVRRREGPVQQGRVQAGHDERAAPGSHAPAELVGGNPGMEGKIASQGLPLPQKSSGTFVTARPGLPPADTRR